MSVYHVHAWCPQKSEKAIRSPGTVVTDCCELPCGCWKSNPGPVEEQPVLLTSEPSGEVPSGQKLMLWKWKGEF
jgi:E3 ubiquitin-protein ligase NEDD4